MEAWFRWDRVTNYAADVMESALDALLELPGTAEDELQTGLGWVVHKSTAGRWHVLMNGRNIASMCWTLLTVGLSTGTVVLWRGGSTHNEGLKIGGLLLLVAAVIVAALVG
jgi:hypothetical protein